MSVTTIKISQLLNVWADSEALYTVWPVIHISHVKQTGK